MQTKKAEPITQKPSLVVAWVKKDKINNNVGKKFKKKENYKTYVIETEKKYAHLGQAGMGGRCKNDTHE